MPLIGKIFVAAVGRVRYIRPMLLVNPLYYVELMPQLVAFIMYDLYYGYIVFAMGDLIARSIIFIM